MLALVTLRSGEVGRRRRPPRGEAMRGAEGEAMSKPPSPDRCMAVARPGRALATSRWKGWVPEGGSVSWPHRQSLGTGAMAGRPGWPLYPGRAVGFPKGHCHRPWATTMSLHIERVPTNTAPAGQGRPETWWAQQGGSSVVECIVSLGF